MCYILIRPAGASSFGTSAAPEERSARLRDALERCQLKNDWLTARDIWTEFMSGHGQSTPVDVATADRLCHIALESKDVRGAFAVFSAARRMAVMPAISTYQALIAGLLEEASDLDRVRAAIHLLEELRSLGHVDDETIHLLLRVSAQNTLVGSHFVR